MIERVPAELASGLAEDLSDLYAEVFAEPPYREGPEDVAGFVRRFRRQTRQPGFALVISRTGDALTGMAYGYTMAPDEWWRHCDTPAPPEVAGCAKFAVYELAVRREVRGRGVGRRLLNTLLADRLEQWATLNVNPEAAAAQMYRRWGWQFIGWCRYPGRPVMEVMLLRLRPATP